MGDLLVDLPKENEDAIKSKKATYELLWNVVNGRQGGIMDDMVFPDNKRSHKPLTKLHCRTLRHEARVLESLRTLVSPHFLTLEDRGIVDDRFLFVILKLVGKNLLDLLQELPGKKFSMGTGIRVAEQTLSGIRDLHICGYIHRDIKPDNFAVGREEDDNFHTIFILDFKFARKFRAEGKDLRLERNQAAFRGTPRYASITALSMLRRGEQSPIRSYNNYSTNSDYSRRSSREETT
ncbi:hypothetical protein NECAME_14598 [Necator americanus]|uniref:Protein kinase domain-containing protein n=1 Tax=Necator americanus TaxID=51031 RepID=W2SM52_NECAM|nr:hypothetical protein NECAME_14598 [Necator americanus]ETN70715.1 hypothetical protein NECAME_14598 [Necator americanus]